MDNEKLKNKAKPMKKRNVRLGRSRTSLYFTAPEHPCSMYMSIFKGFRRAPHFNIMEGKRSNLVSRYSCCDLN